MKYLFYNVDCTYSHIFYKRIIMIIIIRLLLTYTSAVSVVISIKTSLYWNNNTYFYLFIIYLFVYLKWLTIGHTSEGSQIQSFQDFSSLA